MATILMQSANTVTISKEDYANLVEASRFLQALEAHGVDNWDGHSDAYRSVYGGEDEEEGDE